MRNIKVMPYLYDNVGIEDCDNVRNKLNVEIPMNMKLNGISELNKIMKVALVDKETYSVETAPPEQFIICCDKDFIIAKIEDDDLIRFRIRNKRFGRFDSAFNIVVVYIEEDDKSVIPISVLVTGTTAFFNKNNDMTVKLDLKKDYGGNDAE